MRIAGEVEITGRIQALTLPAVGFHPTFKVRLAGDELTVDLVFVGHRSLPGFRVGRHMTARGKIVAGDHPVIYNPIYWLKADAS